MTPPRGSSWVDPYLGGRDHTQPPDPPDTTTCRHCSEDKLEDRPCEWCGHTSFDDPLASKTPTLRTLPALAGRGVPHSRRRLTRSEPVMSAAGSLSSRPGAVATAPGTTPTFQTGRNA